MKMFGSAFVATFMLAATDFWALPINDSSANKVKHALLVSAFAAGKTVSLRCENSVLSDFEIYE